MNAPVFLIGRFATGELRWAAIDQSTHHLEGRIADRRFGDYLAPYCSEEDARAALLAAGAVNVETEQRKRHG